LGGTNSAQTPSTNRSHEVRFGARRRARFMMSNWFLTASYSAANVTTPPEVFFLKFVFMRELFILIAHLLVTLARLGRRIHKIAEVFSARI
jgi:hypothetical protein